MLHRHARCECCLSASHKSEDWLLTSGRRPGYRETAEGHQISGGCNHSKWPHECPPWAVNGHLPQIQSELVLQCPDWTSPSWSRCSGLIYSRSSPVNSESLQVRRRPLPKILPGGTTYTLSDYRSITIIHCSPAPGKARSWYNQVLSGCNSLLSDCAWHG